MRDTARLWKHLKKAADAYFEGSLNELPPAGPSPSFESPPVPGPAGRAPPPAPPRGPPEPPPPASSPYLAARRLLCHRVWPHPTAEQGDAAVFGRREWRAGVFLVQVFLYSPSTTSVTASEAYRRDLQLEVQTLGIDEPGAILVWRDVPTAAQFEVDVPADAGTPMSSAAFAS